jgi:hypothetical protein
MARMVKCIKLGREAEGFDFPPYPGELGKLQGAPRLTSRKPGISDPPSVGTVVLLRRAHRPAAPVLLKALKMIRAGCVNAAHSRRTHY